MKTLILLSLLLSGCAAFTTKDDKPGKKTIIKACVIEMLNEDVKVQDAKDICNDIYRRLKE